MPRYMIIRMADSTTEAGGVPSSEMIEAMGAYMERMGQAGILRGAEGLRPTKEGKRVKIPRSGRPRVIDGPFSESKELVGGYALIEVGSEAEAIEWLKQWPPADAFDGEVTLELRRLYEEDDFGEEFKPEARQRERRMRAQIEQT